MRTLALALLIWSGAGSLHAQSIIYTIGPIPVAKVRVDTVTAKQALAKIQPDSGQIARVVDNGDFNGDGSATLSDAMGELYWLLLSGRPGPKGHLIFQLNDNRTGDSVTITCILVDSVGVKLP